MGEKSKSEQGPKKQAPVAKGKTGGQATTPGAPANHNQGVPLPKKLRAESRSVGSPTHSLMSVLPPQTSLAPLPQLKSSRGPIAPRRPAPPRPTGHLPTTKEGDEANETQEKILPCTIDAPMPPELRESSSDTASQLAPPRKQRKRLGDILVEAGVATEADIMRALSVQKMGGGRLGGILVKLKLVTDAQIRHALSSQLGVEVTELGDVELDESVLKLLPRELITKYEAIPVRVKADTLYIAMKDPYNFAAVDDIRFFTGMRKVVVLACTEADYKKFVDEHLHTQSLIEEILEGGDFYDRAISAMETEEEADPANHAEEEEDFVHDLRLAGGNPPIITLCNFLLVESINRRASDIHIEPYETYFRVRVRVDGRLQTLITPPQRLHGPMIARMKIMADMDIAKRREPQDGHIAIVYRGETCHYRVSTLPTVYGEKCVIRLLKKEEGLADLDKLGFDAELLKRLKRGLKSPQGMVLVTGPTGSGKTTTLHAGLAYINDTETNIVTLEDPVEASLPGVNHVQIHEKAGVSFSSGLRSILRQDPDVVFVGEMRDPEVSKIAIKASLTGHLVLSTLHTNSAAESLMRLQDMGIPGYLVANALIMIVAQRLVRKNCKLCALPYQPSPEEIDEFELNSDLLKGAELMQGPGCEGCHGTGYLGRIAVYELLSVSGAIRVLIRKGAPVEEIIQQAADDGMEVLYRAGIGRALAGETSLAEIRRCLIDAR